MLKLYQEAEKYIKDIFWEQSHNKDNKIDIEKIVGAKLLKDNVEKDPEYYNHRAGVIHVTSLSKCLRGVVLEMLGAKKDSEEDAHKLGVFKAGNLFEDFIVDSLGDLMLDRQTEYVYVYKNIILTGRDDGTIGYEGTRTILENKSVHSDSFWNRKREGDLCASHNQTQLQTYLWLRRILPNVFIRQVEGSDKEEIIYTNLSLESLIKFKGAETKARYTSSIKPDNSSLNGLFCYISKDDCTIEQAPIKFNPNILNEIILPTLDLINDAYVSKDPKKVPIPEPTLYSSSKGQYQKNWIASYCDYHSQCAGAGWILEAQNAVVTKNKEAKEKMSFSHTIKKVKPNIEVVG